MKHIDDFFERWFELTNGFLPISVGWEACEPGHFFGPGIRDFYVMHFVLSGTGTFSIKGKEYHPKAGDLFIIPPHEISYYEASEDDPFHYVWINFITTTGHIRNAFDFHIMHAPFLRPVFTDIQNYPDMNTNGLAYISECLANIATQLSSLKSAAEQLVINAMQYMHNHYSNENLSITEIAGKLQVNRCKLSSCFSTIKNMSPMEYLIRYRLERACHYMCECNASPSVAAFSVGYRNYSNFSKMFRKYYGMSPRDYQEKTLSRD